MSIFDCFELHPLQPPQCLMSFEFAPSSLKDWSELEYYVTWQKCLCRIVVSRGCLAVQDIFSEIATAS
jgi:hypothetical protein